MTHSAQRNNWHQYYKYFVGIDFHTALMDSLPSNLIKIVFLYLSRCSAVITMKLLLLQILVSWGQGGMDGSWDGFPET